MKVLQIKVSKKQLEEIQNTKRIELVLKLDQLSSVFQMDNGEVIMDNEYEEVGLVNKYDGILLLQCRSKYPYQLLAAVPSCTGMPYADTDDIKEQVITYTLGEPIAKEEPKEAEIVEL